MSREAIITKVNAKWSNVETIVFFLRNRYEFTDSKVLAPCISADQIQEMYRDKDVLYETIKSRIVLDKKNNITNGMLYLSAMPSDEEIYKAIEIFYEQHNLYQIIEDIFEQYPDFACGNILDIVDEDVFNRFVSAIDFKYTSIQNVLKILNIIYLDKTDSYIGKDCVVGRMSYNIDDIRVVLPDGRIISQTLADFKNCYCHREYC